MSEEFLSSILAVITKFFLEFVEDEGRNIDAKFGTYIPF